jgi:hypothetical protein
LEPLSSENSQGFKTSFSHPVSGIGKPCLAGVIGKNQGLESKKGKRPRDGADVVGIANPIENKMNGAKVF